MVGLVSMGLVAGCGYGFTGTGNLPGDVNTIAVTVLTNRTAETGLETTMTNALIEEMTRRRQDLVVAASDAEATLSGTIESLTDETQARSGLQTAVQRRVRVKVTLILTDRSKEVLWTGRQLTVDQVYAVGDDPVVTENNRRLAIEIVARQLAQYAYERLTDAF